ncbi:MAG: type III secretion system chaperone [Chlamydiales bacterium]|nr:type III secretion system chaperone [Chlamydiales bacterium]
MLDHHLSALYKELGLDKEPEKADDKSYIIAISAKAQMHVWDLFPGFLFKAVLGPLPNEEVEEHLIYYSKANLVGQGTGRCRIGLDADGKQLVMVMHDPEDISYQGFKERTEEFANFVDYWKDQL